MANIEHARQVMLKVAKDMDFNNVNMTTKKSIVSVNLGKSKSTTSQGPMPMTGMLSFERRLLTSFHSRNPIANQITIAKFVTAETKCQGLVLLRILDHDLFRIYFRETTPCKVVETYDLDDFISVKSVVERRDNLVYHDENNHALSQLVQWKPLFTFIPDYVVAIPIQKIDNTVCAVIGIAFKKKIPPKLMTFKLPQLKPQLEVLVPYAMTLQAMHDSIEQNSVLEAVLSSLDIVDKFLYETDKLIQAIGSELASLVGCSNLTIFTIELAENAIFRYRDLGRDCKSEWGCPQPQSHIRRGPFPILDKTPVGWVATHMKVLKMNDPSEAADYGLSKKSFHSIGSCVRCKNVLCVPIIDHSLELPLIIELTDKEEEFSAKDVEKVMLFVQHVSSVHTTSVMLRHREIASRRNSIVTRILLNIEPIKRPRVEQFLSSENRMNAAGTFKGKFNEFVYNIKLLPEPDMGVGIFHIFVELGLVRFFKIHRATLIRFLLSTQMGYRPLPYHNWQHACSVTHFGYVMIKNLRLLEVGYLSNIEILSLIVSAIVHDIDHRGTNNRFQSCTNSDLYQLYNTQESILERHHLAMALQILQKEECNILENLTEKDYKDFVELLTWNILATDIAKYLQTRETNFKHIRSFKKGDKADKLALLSLMMTAADVNDCVKSWDDCVVSVRQILAEFFNQGDLERGLGMVPMAMMDRKQAFIPEVEYKFISGIVMPVYKELAAVFPPIKTCVETLERSEEYWEVATVLFENRALGADQLSYLKLPQMTETGLKKLREEKGGIQNFKRLKPIEEQTNKDKPQHGRRDTVVSSLMKNPSMTPSIVAMAPEDDFRRMFKNTKDQRVDDSDIIDMEGAGCCTRCWRRMKCHKKSS